MKKMAVILMLATGYVVLASEAHAQTAPPAAPPVPVDPIIAKFTTQAQGLAQSINTTNFNWPVFFDTVNNDLIPAYTKAKADLAKAAGDLNAANDKNAKLEDDIKKLQAENDKLKGVAPAAAPTEPKAEAPKP